MITLQELEHLIQEDCPYGDLTTHSLGLYGRRGRMSFRARDLPLISASVEAAVRIAHHYDVEVIEALPSGASIPPFGIVLILEGEVSTLHRLWKSLQNLLDYTCGIATYTHTLLTLARQVQPHITLATTRKNTPFTKALALDAVCAGGGIIHRMGLSESLLVFPYHRIFFEDDRAFEEAFAQMKRHSIEKKIIMECESLEDALYCARIGADILQIDHMEPTPLAHAIGVLKEHYPHLRILATGGINHTNVQAYAATHADMLVTSAPYFAPSANLKVLMEPR